MNYSYLGFVYAIKHPVTKDIAYIGSTRSPDDRFYQHCLVGGKSDVSFWIRLLKDHGLQPLFEILKVTSWHSMHDLEREEIFKHKSKGLLLLNRKQGGNKFKIINR